MKDFSKNVTRWISGLTKDQFDEFVKVFIKDYFKIDTVSLSDGKGDGGIDIQIFQNRVQKKIPIQLTVDSNVYNKLEKDFVKIYNTIENHKYSDNFYFFYSKGAAREKVDDLKETAKRDYSIGLEIFDNKLISTYLEKSEFYLSREKLREILGEFLKEESEYFDEKDKMYFDLLNHNSDSVELKERFIYAYTLNEFLNSSNNSLDKNEIQKKLENEFNLQNPEYYTNKVIEKLISKSKIELIDGKYKLTEDEKKHLISIKKDADLLEREFISKLQEVIKKFEGNIELKVILDKIHEIFKKYNEIDLNEINENLENSFTDNFIVNELISYVKENLKNSEETQKFINEVINLCSINDFIIKVSAGKLYRDLVNSDEFDAYSRRLNKEVFFDTPVLIYLLLAMKQESFDYYNYRYKIAKNLFQFINENHGNIVFNTIEPYIVELADYLNNTIKLIPIYELGFLESLGGSSNEILNFYLKLKEESSIEESFEEFIKDFGISTEMALKERDNNYLQQYLIQLFKDNNINIDVAHKYDTDYQTKSEFLKVSRTLGEIYARAELKRNPRSLKFDSLFFMHIYDSNIELIDPTVITWDNTFREFRSEYQTKNPSLRYWHLFKPGKFLDHISLLNFKINGEAISNEVLAMIDIEFEVVKGVKKLSDVLASIIDLKSKSGTKLTNGLIQIREVYIYEINKDEAKEIEINSETPQPVDEIVSNVFDYYIKNESQYSLENFTTVLKNDEAIVEILKLFQEESNYFMKYNKYRDNYKDDFDSIIKKFLDN
jgi:hypothetical protein